MPTKLIGLFIIVFGALALTYGGFHYMYPDTLVNVGKLDVTVQRRGVVLVPPVIGAIAVVGGLALFLRTPKGA